MIAKKTEAELIGRAVVDAGFRKKLLADPEHTIQTEGYDVSHEMLLRIKETATAMPDAIDAAIHAAARDGGVGG